MELLAVFETSSRRLLPAKYANITPEELDSGCDSCVRLSDRAAEGAHSLDRQRNLPVAFSLFFALPTASSITAHVTFEG